MQLALLALIPIVIFANLSPADAQESSDSARPDLSWYFSNFVHEVDLLIHFDQDKKAEIINNHINDIQARIDEKIVNQEPIPRQFEERRLEKLTALENAIDRIETNQVGMATEKSNALTVLRDRLISSVSNIKAFTDINEIRICVSEFSKLKNPDNWNYDGGEADKQALADLIDTKCNKLESAKKLCNIRIDSLALASVADSYGRLGDYCPTFKLIPVTQARTLLYGDT